MHSLATWEQSPTFDPYNPNQIVREAYVGIPGGYGSFYFNRVPTKTTLQGLSAGLSSLPMWGQIAIIGGLAAAAGYLGMKYVGPKVGLAGSDYREAWRRRHEGTEREEIEEGLETHEQWMPYSRGSKWETRTRPVTRAEEMAWHRQRKRVKASAKRRR